MRNLDDLTAKRILANKSPEALFSQFSSEAKQEYRNLALCWHPDNRKTSEASEVFAHIALLYKQAIQKIEDGSWEEPCEKIEEEVSGKKKFRLENGAVKTFDYYASRPFELGTMYIGDHSVIYELRAEFADLFHNGRRQIGQLSFMNESMAAEMSKFLPQVIDAFRTSNGKNVLCLRKTPDQFLLADVLAYYGNKIDPIEHVGWILNVLFHIACYLEWSGVAHNAISPETFFISPMRHSGMLLGGWWYSCRVGAEMIAVPDTCLDFIPEEILREKRADIRADLELIKAIGRTILGDSTGGSLRFDNSLPSRLTDSLNFPAIGRAIDDYRDWKYEVLVDCFGSPSFVPMDLAKSDLYKEK